MIELVNALREGPEKSCLWHNISDYLTLLHRSRVAHIWYARFGSHHVYSFQNNTMNKAKDVIAEKYIDYKYRGNLYEKFDEILRVDPAHITISHEFRGCKQFRRRVSEIAEDQFFLVDGWNVCEAAPIFQKIIGTETALHCFSIGTHQINICEPVVFSLNDMHFKKEVMPVKVKIDLGFK